MGKITYITGSIFEAPKGSWLLHSCNLLGVWGSGVALGFKERFPKSYDDYKRYCAWNREEGAWTGDYRLHEEENGYRVISLIGSRGYGALLDPPTRIVQATHHALASLFFNHPNAHIHSPRINAGLFRVPWALTESVIEDVLKVYPDAKWSTWVPPDTK